MLSIEECRKHLKENSSQTTDEEIEQIRETLYQIANVLVNNYLEVKNNANSNLHKSINKRAS